MAGPGDELPSPCHVLASLSPPSASTSGADWWFGPPGPAHREAPTELIVTGRRPRASGEYWDGDSPGHRHREDRGADRAAPQRVAEPSGPRPRGVSRRHIARWAITSVLAGALAAVLLPGIPGGLRAELAGRDASPSTWATPAVPEPPLTPFPPPPVIPVPNDPAPNVAAGSTAVDLNGWKLTVPVAGNKGSAAIINPASSAEPWLTRNRNGSLTFWAPVDGATTANSEHPRTELDSLRNFTAGQGNHVLTATLSIQQAPSDKSKIIIGQIHGAETISSVPFVMLQWESGTVMVVVKQARGGPTSAKYPLLTGVPLTSRFHYSISDPGNGNLVFSATHGADTKMATAPIPAPFLGARVRFQAGAYQQGEGGGGPGDGARLTFYELRE